MSQNSGSLFIDKFTEIFSHISKGNQLYGRLAAHVILGQVLKNCKIYSGHIYVDPRISIFVIQPSATGKSTPWGYIAKVAKEAGIQVDEIDEATDAALVGTIEPEEVIDPETKTKVIQYNKVNGKLATAELLHFDEGSMLLDRNEQYASHTMTWFQKALNPLGSEQSKITKKLAHGDQIEYYPSCSLLITSHPLEGVMETILNKGFFQRIILYPRDIPIHVRQAIEYERADELGVKKYTELEIKGLGTSLQDIRSKFNTKEPEFNINVRPVIKAKIKAFYEVIKDAHPRVKEIMATFIPRYDNYLAILAFHKMCDRNGEKVEIQDINYAFSVLYLLFKELMNWVEETADFYKMGNKDMNYLRLAQQMFSRMNPDIPQGYVMKMNFVARCSAAWKLSRVTVQKYLDRFQGYGKLKEIELENIRYIKMEM